VHTHVKQPSKAQTASHLGCPLRNSNAIFPVGFSGGITLQSHERGVDKEWSRHLGSCAPKLKHKLLSADVLSSLCTFVPKLKHEWFTIK